MLLKNNIYLLTLVYNKGDEIYRLMTLKDRNNKSKEMMIELICQEFSLIDFFITENM